VSRAGVSFMPWLRHPIFENPELEFLLTISTELSLALVSLVSLALGLCGILRLWPEHYFLPSQVDTNRLVRQPAA
jgi:hypothetical protein